MEQKIRKAIDEAIAEVLAGTGEEIYLVEAAIRGGGRKIELTVDTDRGISIDLCAKLSRRVRERLESDEEFEPLAGGDFDLMVSSPGIGEPIRVSRQYRRHLGRLFKVAYLDSEEERQEAAGRLLEAVIEGDEPRIVLEPVTSAKKKKKAEVPPLTLRLADIVKATVQIEL
jgi:ribosome maturation factor RimP